MKIAKMAAVPALLAGVMLAGSADAALVSRNFEWVGTTGLNGYNAGYTASGTFTYDDTYSIVAAEGFENGDFNNGLESLTISFDFLGDSGLQATTFYDVVAGVINYDYLTFEFNTATQQFTNMFDMGQDSGNIFEYYIAGTIGGQSWMVESDSLDDLNTIANATTITVSAVPVPVAVWLFGTGLAGLMGVARRGNRNA